MKTILKITTVIAMLFLSFNTYATESSLSLKVNKVEGKSISFTLKRDQKINLNIYNHHQAIIHSEKILGRSTVKRTLDLNHLSEGIYFLVVANAEKLARFQITISDKLASLNESPISEVYKVQFSLNENFLDVNIPNISESVKISIYDDQINKLLYSSNLEAINGNVRKKFNLSNKYVDSNELGRTYLIKVDYEHGTVYRRLFIE